MKTFRVFQFSALGFALAVSVHARLGDTLAEATARYGAAKELKSKLPATSSQGFTAGERAIEADFINGAVHRVTYRLPRAFTTEEIQKLLAENTGTYSWLEEHSPLNPVRDAVGPRAWRRSDRGSAFLTRQTKGEALSESLVLTDATWLMANLKLKSAPKPAAPPASAAITPAAPAPAPASPASAATPIHSLSWTDYDGVTNPAAAHLVLDGQDLGSGAEVLAALKQRLAALPAKSQVKITPYYGDPGGAALKHPPFNLAELRTYCEARELTLLVPQSQ